MVAFFSRIPPGGANEFSLFTTTYFIAVILCTIALVLIWIFLPKLKHKKYEPYVRYGIIIFVIFTSLYKQSYHYQYDYPWYEYLPDATCGWSIVFGSIALITKNRKTFVLTFFWGWGALSALYAPNVLEGPTRYYFYQFFVRHILIIVFALYMIRVFDFKIYKKDYWLYFFVTIPMTIVGLIFSLIINDPEHLNMFYMLGPAVNNPFLVGVLEVSHTLYIVVWLSVASLLGYIYGLPFYEKER